MKFRIAWLSVSLVLAIAPLTASARDDRTTRELKALTPVQADKIARADLLSVLKPTGPYRSGMRRQVRAAVFDTEPVGSSFLNLCRRDTLFLRYAPVEDSAPPESQKLRPYGVETVAAFHFAHAPAKYAEDMSPGLQTWDENCTALGDRDDVQWFTAADEEAAFQGTRLMLDALSAIRDGSLKAEPCPRVDDKAQTCEETILKWADFDTIDDIRRCNAPDGQICYSIIVRGDIALTIRAESDRSRIAGHGRVLSIHVDQLIVVT